ncbi:MAG: hypothetical protein ABFQ89_03630 [Chloroflexota bacterium]
MSSVEINPLGAVLLAASCAALIIVTAEFLHRRGLSGEITRKLVHIGAGLYVPFALLVFTRRSWTVIPPLVFALVNFVVWRFGWLPSISQKPRSRPGIILYPLVIAIAIYAMWETPWMAIGTVLPMSFGDAAAAVVGIHWGKHRYQAFGADRSVEGSAAMFLVSGIALFVTLSAFGMDDPLIPALLAASLATIVEGISPPSVDNVTVPAVTLASLAIFSM